MSSNQLKYFIMITLLIIVVCVFIIVYIAQSNVKEFEAKFNRNEITKEESNKLIASVNKPIVLIGLLLMGFLIIMVNVYTDNNAAEKVNEEVSNPMTDNSESTIDTVTTKIELTENQKFLKDNNFKIDADFSDGQFKEFKSAINTGLFKEVSFCEVYQKGLKLDGKPLKQFLKKYSKIPYFEEILFMYGPKVCNAYSDADMETRKPNKSNYDSSIYQSSDLACINSEDFIKQDLRYPSSADFSILDCSANQNSNGSYTVLRKVGAKNAFGVESEFIYKLTLGFKGGNDADINDWQLINMRSEEVR